MTLEEYISARLFANRQIEHDNGDVTWVPVNLDVFNQEDQFQVFDYRSGTYEYFDNLAAAKVRWDEHKQRATEEFQKPIILPVAANPSIIRIRF